MTALGLLVRRAHAPHCLRAPSPRRAGLGLGGVLIVAAAVAGSLGLCSWAGMRGTLIIMEVIPFLVLAGRPPRSARCPQRAPAGVQPAMGMVGKAVGMVSER